MDEIESMERTELLKQLGMIESEKVLDAQATILALRPYTNLQIYEAYVDHKMRSPYAMKVCEVIEYFKRKNGENVEAMEQKAALIYEKYFKYPLTGYDHVADERTVYAFKVAFGSLAEYGSRSNFIDGVDKKDFIKAYVNARPEDYKLAGNVIAGRNHKYALPNPTVVCIGEQAINRAREIYGDRVQFSNLTPKKQLPKALPRNEEPVLSLEEIEKNRRKVNELISNYLLTVKTVQ